MNPRAIFSLLCRSLLLIGAVLMLSTARSHPATPSIVIARLVIGALLAVAFAALSKNNSQKT